ncbi:methyltransferase domain-containing protein [Cellulomonas hominis]|uniref:class I SAM-dependent methyltransferase n=1 Tax=Cellulomonas hominis TaxID=156981 RepID=UPI001C117619|nr:class I SAM-dependent methyltransferase [Cellulomonas hominis]MBU5423725.1 methyltransferase domain-containing protein [Cellulomonas hominis]
MTDAALAVNQRNWDAAVPGHLVAYGVDDFVADPGRVSSVVRDDLALLAPHLPGGSPAGLDLVHLQCHIGLDTLSWARLGARVTGVDFSPAATAAGREIASRAGLAATFVDSDVDHALDACPGPFDVVYTGIGALCWLPDLTRWARVVAGLLRPGGTFYVRDAHPALQAVDAERTDGLLVLADPYFGSGTPRHYAHTTTYAGTEVPEDSADTYEWQHDLGEIVQALLDAGLRLTSLAEHRSLPWRALPQMVREGASWVLPEGADRLPLAFSLTATR